MHKGGRATGLVAAVMIGWLWYVIAGSGCCEVSTVMVNTGLGTVVLGYGLVRVQWWIVN